MLFTLTLILFWELKDALLGPAWEDDLSPQPGGQLVVRELHLTTTTVTASTTTYTLTSQSAEMPLGKWSRIYYSADGRTGVVMLAIEKVHASQPRDPTWTAVDPIGRVQAIITRDREKINTTPKARITYGDVPGFSPAELIKFERLPVDLIRRANPLSMGALVQGRRRRSRHRQDAFN